MILPPPCYACLPHMHGMTDRRSDDCSRSRTNVERRWAQHELSETRRAAILVHLILNEQLEQCGNFLHRLDFFALSFWWLASEHGRRDAEQSAPAFVVDLNLDVAIGAHEILDDDAER